MAWGFMDCMNLAGLWPLCERCFSYTYQFQRCVRWGTKRGRQSLLVDCPLNVQLNHFKSQTREWYRKCFFKFCWLHISHMQVLQHISMYLSNNFFLITFKHQLRQLPSSWPWPFAWETEVGLALWPLSLKTHFNHVTMSSSNAFSTNINSGR